MNIAELLDLDELDRDIAAGYVTSRPHSEFPELAILNYTPATQYANYWNATTKQCRGLIYNIETGEVVARPFAKFMNYGQDDEHAKLDLGAPILGAFEKFDGSLGVGLRTPDGRLAIATRGSFHSEQAEHATEKVGEVAHLFIDGKTPLFEIIYPDNAIVVRYGDRDELVHLGWVDNETGAYEPPATLSSFAGTLADALAVPPRENAEGLVVWMDPHTAVKLKQDDYLALHRAIFGLSAKEVWRQLMAGTFDAFVQGLPDEFQPQVEGIASELRSRQSVRLSMAQATVATLRTFDLPTQKDKALWVTENVPARARGWVFTLLAGRDPSEAILKTLEPMGAGMTL